jgi:hypothetical protein
MTTKAQQAEQEEAAKSLRKLLTPGQTVYCLLRRRSSSGMSRVIDLLIAIPDIREEYPQTPDGRNDYSAKPKQRRVGQKIRSIGYTAAKAMGDRWDSDAGGIKVSGTGMDMGFATVYDLGRTLWPKGAPCPGKLLCRSNDHVNPGPDRDRYGKGVKHSDGGYTLKHEWL